MLRIYVLIDMILAPIFLITTLVGYSKYKSQSAKVVLLQEELSNLKAAQVSKVIEKMDCIDPKELKSTQGGAVYEALMGNTYGLLECKLRHQALVDVVSLYQFTEYVDD